MSSKNKITVKQEIIRKFFHLPVLVFPFLPYFFELDVIKIVLSIVFLLIIIVEIYRHINEKFWINTYLRVEERVGIAVYNFTFLSWIAIVYPVDYFYPYFVFTLATVPTLLGDATAAIIGRKYGKRRLIFTKQKTIEGAISGFISALVLGYLMLFIANVNIHTYLLLPLIPAIVLTLLDFLEDLPYWLSDNMIYVIVSAIIMAFIIG